MAESQGLVEIFSALFDADREAVRVRRLERARVRLSPGLGGGSSDTLAAYELGVLDALQALEEIEITLKAVLERVWQVQ